MDGLLPPQHYSRKKNDVKWVWPFGIANNERAPGDELCRVLTAEIDMPSCIFPRSRAVASAFRMAARKAGPWQHGTMRRDATRHGEEAIEMAVVRRRQRPSPAVTSRLQPSRSFSGGARTKYYHQPDRRRPSHINDRDRQITRNAPPPSRSS